MSKCTFFDDQQPTGDLPHWATITQVSMYLAVPRSTVRDTVRRALASGEAWVKKEEVEPVKHRYLIDTTHELYKAHEQRWRQHQMEQEEEEMAFLASSQPAFSHGYADSYAAYPPSSPSSPLAWPGSSDPVLSHWPVFRQRLHSCGLQVFQNILADEWQLDSWQWRWGDLHGEGYISAEEAITAAIERRLIANAEACEEPPSKDASHLTPSTAPALDQAKPARFNPFSSRGR
jgi:hypothetical protein